MRVIDSLATPGTEPGERANYKGGVVIWSGAIWRDSGERVPDPEFDKLLEKAGFPPDNGESEGKGMLPLAPHVFTHAPKPRSRRARRSDPETSHLAGLPDFPVYLVPHVLCPFTDIPVEDEA